MTLSDLSKEVEWITNSPTREDLAPLKQMIDELNKGLPSATEEVLSSRVAW